MGNVIKFPHRHASNIHLKQTCSENSRRDIHLDDAYQRDLDRAVTLLREHIQSRSYDGFALILKPTSRSQPPALVVAGAYRHNLIEAAEACMKLHVGIKLRAADHASQAVRNLHPWAPGQSTHAKSKSCDDTW